MGGVTLDGDMSGNRGTCAHQLEAVLISRMRMKVRSVRGQFMGERWGIERH